MEISEAQEQFERMMSITSHGPFMHLLSDRGDDDFNFTVRHLPELLSRMMSRLTKQISIRERINKKRPVGKEGKEVKDE